MIDPEEPNVRAATLGKIFEDFVDGPIGSYLLERARQESEEAAEALKTVDASDANKVRALQLKAQIADKIPQWLGEVIAQGHTAINALKEDYENG